MKSLEGMKCLRCRKRVHMLASFWLLNVPSLFSIIPLASAIRVNLGWKQQAWLPHLIQIYSWIGKRTQQKKKFCLQTFKTWVKCFLRKRVAQTPTMMTVVRKKKESWRQVSVFCTDVLTNRWFNTKCRSHSSCMDWTQNCLPTCVHVFPAECPRHSVLSHTHTCNSIHLQWDLFYVTWHSFRRSMLQVILPTLCPSTPFSLWLQLSTVLRHICFLSESKILLWTHSTMGMLKNTSRTEGPREKQHVWISCGTRHERRQTVSSAVHGRRAP